MACSCNVGLVPVVKPVIPALTEGRLVDAQARIPITADWGGGHVASVDGMRFVVPVKSLHAPPPRSTSGSGSGLAGPRG